MPRHLRSRVTLLALAGGLVAVAAPSAQTRLDMTALLKSYSAGRFDETIRTIQRAGDSGGRDLREQWGAARPWIEGDPADRGRRYLAAAALALETEILRAERNDWMAPRSEDCAGRCVLEWACLLLHERGDP